MNDDDDQLDPQLRALFAAAPSPADNAHGADDAAFVARMEAALQRARRARRLQRLLLAAAALGLAVAFAPRVIDVSVALADRSAGWVQSPFGWAIAGLAAFWALRLGRA